MSQGNDSPGFAVGIIVGAAIGIIVGLIYAPRTGKETRQLLRDRAEEIKEKAEGVVEKMREVVPVARREASSGETSVQE